MSNEWILVLNNRLLIDWLNLLNSLILNHDLRLVLGDVLWDIGRFFSEVDFDFTIGDDIAHLIITSKFVVIIVLDLDSVVFLDFIFIDEFLDDEFSDLLDGLG